MKKTLSLITASLLAMSTSPLFAADAPSDLSVVSTNSSSISLDWSDVDDAMGYYSYYGTSTGVDGSYEVEGIDLITESEYVLEGLNADTTYYMTITSVDELGNESDYAQEVDAITIESAMVDEDASDAGNFMLQNASVVSDQVIDLYFSNTLDSSVDASREFIIAETETGDEVYAASTELMGDAVVRVTLENSLQTDTDYEVTVLDISDENGSTIESGVNAFTSFTTLSQFEELIDLNAAAPVTNEESQDETLEDSEDTLVVEEEMMEETMMNSEDEQSDNAGTTMTDADISENVSEVAKQNDALPKTGPEHILLVLLAVLIAGGIFVIQKRSA